MTQRPSPLLLICALVGALVFSFAAHAAGDPFKNRGGATGNPLSGQAQPEFLPVEQAYRLGADFEDGRLVLRWQIADGYYLYRHRFAFNATPGGALNAQLPAGKGKEDEYFGHVEVYYHDVDARLTELPAGPFTLSVTSQGCADAGLCYPPHTDYLRVDPAAGTIAATGAPPHSATPAAPADTGGEHSAGLWLTMLLSAMAGGVILNLMPCVFPVLSLKVLSFARHGGQRRLAHGLLYLCGVVLSFLLVAGALLGLKAAGHAVGWGFQLQQPWFVGALAYLFFAMGLSLSGFWELGGRWMGLGEGLAGRGGYSGSFFTGVLATLVASPCTAPFMGSALGFASTQPAPLALGIFAALGLGMALPVVLLCLSPRLLAHIPKPGAWMDRFKQALAFPLYATAIWLCWIVGRQTSASGMAILLGGALALTLALWLWRFGLLARCVAAASLALAVGLLASSWLTTAAQSQPAGAAAVASDWQPYRNETLTRLRAAGKPVFLNVTADWCITCLTNERVALGNGAVKNVFSQRGITTLKADWTHYDPDITALLSRFGRSGVPLYVYFPADREQAPVVLPQLLTPSRVVESIGG